MKTQHTPGPWELKIDKETSGNWHYGIFRKTDYAPDRHHICVLNGRLKEIEANAHLIEAVPDLLEAAEMALKVWPDHLRGSLLEQAINKARGGA